MYDFPDRVLRTILNLLLAMVNATLILVALCLFLALRLANAVGDYAEEVADDIAIFEPLRADVQMLASEVAGMRADLGAIMEQSGAMTSEAGEALAARIEDFDARLDGMRERAGEINSRLDELSIDPGQAIETAVAELTVGLAGLAGCERPAASVPPPG